MSRSRDARHDHPRQLTSERDRRFVLLALALIATLFVLEVAAAIVAHSLVLFADAGHLLTDVGALSLSAWAIRLAARPARGRWTYGLQRVEILSAAANGVALAAVSLLIAVAAVQRLVDPRAVHGAVVLVVAGIGALVNVVCAWVLARADRTSLNLRGAYLHVVTDLYAFIGTAIAGLVIVVTGWERADAVASLFIVALTAAAAWGLLRDAGRILLQATPEGLDLDDVRAHLRRVNHVLEVHDLHAWTLTSGSYTVSAHVVVEDHCFDSGHAPQVLDALQACVKEHFTLSHATFQLEPSTHENHEDELHH